MFGRYFSVSQVMGRNITAYFFRGCVHGCFSSLILSSVSAQIGPRLRSPFGDSEGRERGAPADLRWHRPVSWEGSLMIVDPFPAFPPSYGFRACVTNLCHILMKGFQSKRIRTRTLNAYQNLGFSISCSKLAKI